MTTPEMTSEKTILLTPEQKAVKAKIMQDLFVALYENIEKNHGIFDGEGIGHLIVNCLILFNRDTLIDFIEQSNVKAFSPTAPERFIDELFKIIKSETLEHLQPKTATPGETQH